MTLGIFYFVPLHCQSERLAMQQMVNPRQPSLHLVTKIKLIENDSDLRYALDNNLPIAIEVGKLETNDAKKILVNNGYYTDNLWTIRDVTDKFDCNEQQAYEVLDSALRNEATVEQIHFAINEKCSVENYLEKV